MTRLAPRLFTLCSAASLLLCVAVGVLWVRSYWVADALARQWTYTLVGAGTSRGGALLYTLSGPPIPTGKKLVPYGVRHTTHEPSDLDDSFVQLGFSADPFGSFRYDVGPGVSSRGTRLHEVTVRALGFPLWCPFAVTALLPAIWLNTLVRQRRRKKLRLCASCGYDLRASPERCPECGTPATTKGTT